MGAAAVEVPELFAFGVGGAQRGEGAVKTVSTSRGPGDVGLRHETTMG
jgi:hypothetical protein